VTAISAPIEISSTPPTPAELLRQLDSRIEPVPVGPLYRIGLILVAVVMILLPLVYIALIALAAYFVYWHATNNTFILEGGGRERGAGRGALLMYAGTTPRRSGWTMRTRR
jgi:hypothetical protein